MVGARFNDHAVHCGDTVIGEQALEIIQAHAIHRTSDDEELAASVGVICKLRFFFLGDIRLRLINEHSVGFFRHAVVREQGELRRFDVFLGDLICEGLRQLLFTVAFEHVKLRQLVGDNVVDRRGDRAFAVEGRGVGIRVEIRIRHINILVSDVAAAVAAFDDETVVRHILIGVLLRERRIHVRIFLLDRDMVRKAVILIEQRFDDRILLVGLHDPVDRHIVLEVIHNRLRVARDRVKLRRAHVKLREIRRQRRNSNVHK